MTFGVLQVVLIGLNGLTTCPGPTVLHHRFHHMTADLPLLHCPNSRGALFDAVHNTRLCRWQCFVVRGRGASCQDSSFVVESTTPVPRALLSEEQIHHRAARHAQTKMAIRKEGSLPGLRVGHRVASYLMCRGDATALWISDGVGGNETAAPRFSGRPCNLMPMVAVVAMHLWAATCTYEG